MKLAEALILRADYQKRAEQLKNRMVANAKVQEGEESPEDPVQLMNEFEKVVNDIESLIRRINRTNSLTPFQANMTLSDALAARDMLLLRRSAYHTLAEAASVRHDRYSRSEVKFVSVVNVAELQKKVDELSQQYRLLDSSIQAANWNTDLME
jgi:hypothetical protein